ncbi:hypothetical protein GCM10011316_23800 [Roseibium aquae]|uniref:Phage head-tail adapter protein n=1 Tax=Roseibium aquae TaxID=1323746 RepID=A0A916X2J7_9HYPH|nr:phage head closure protein [Roseibium aquae]GGB50979.1 hypothetical protein GCM10011316_23800 [Roseibium aquae]
MARLQGAGAFNVAVELRQPVRTDSPDGSVAVVFLDAGRDFAKLELVGQREQEVLDRLESLATHRITLRYREDVAGGWQVVVGNRTYRILAAHDPDGLRRILKCLAEEAGE